MDANKISVLARKHVVSILIFLSEHDIVNKTDLVAVVHSNTSVDKLVNELEEKDFILVRKEFAGRNTYYISLTDKGQAVARILKEAEELAEARTEPDDYKGKIKICPFCNTVNDIDADYCKHCGAKLE